MACCCEHGEEPLGSIKCGNFLTSSKERLCSMMSVDQSVKTVDFAVLTQLHFHIFLSFPITYKCTLDSSVRHFSI